MGTPEGSGTVGIYAWCDDLASTPGGIESYVVNLAHQLAGRGIGVVVHCLGAGRAGWHVHDGEFQVGPHLREVGPALRTFVPAHGPGFAGAVAENVTVSRRFDERLVLAFGTRDGYVFDLAAAAARELSRPAVAFYYHSADERWFRGQFTSRGAGVAGLAGPDERAAFDAAAMAAIRALGAAFDAVVVPTEYVRGQLSTLLPPAQAARLVVAYHGCDPAVFAPRAEAWDGIGPWLHVSRCSVPNAVHKNFTWSCELVAAAVAAGPPLADVARLDLLGQGNAEPLVREYANQNGLGDRIAVSGVLTQRELAERYRRAAFLLVPSMMEAGCTVIVEAVLSGCVPVVLDAAGSGEVMRRLGLDALLVRGVPRRFGDVETVEPDRAQALAVLARCRRDPAGTADLLASAAGLARSHYTLEPTLAALDAGLRRLGVTLVGGPPAG